MIVLEISLSMKGLWLDRIYHFFRGMFIKNVSTKMHLVLFYLETLHVH